MKGLRGKRAIVTGGADGIGRAIVERFAEEGTETIVFDIRPKAPAHRQVDITDYEAVKQAVVGAGPVDILVNNAGWDMFKPFLKTEPDFWQKIISLNLIGAMNVLHCVLPGHWTPRLDTSDFLPSWEEKSVSCQSVSCPLARLPGSELRSSISRWGNPAA